MKLVIIPPRTSMKSKDRDNLMQLLKKRFNANMVRHGGIAWQDVEARIADNADALESLHAMEESGGEPDVVDTETESGHIVFYDCSPQSPAGRRSACYDRAALDSRKANKPANSAIDMASDMGITLLTEEEYRALQTLGEFDTKTSSWIATPDDVRSLGGALFCDRRFNKVFVYHNGAESYYAARGFRGALRV